MKWSLLFLISISFSPFISSQNNTNKLKSEAIQNINIGLFGEAIELLNNYVSANPQDPSGYHLRGGCYEKRSQYELAVYDYRSCLKLASNNIEYKKDLDRAVNSWYSLLYNKIVGYEREIAINPETPLNYLEIGKCYKNLGEWEKAETWYDEYLKREEASSDEVLRYTEILSKTHHLEKGEKILKRYVEKYPNDHRLWSRYGYFTMWLGKKNVSINAFEKALELRPYFKEAMDGYDLVRGKGHVYTVNDTTSRYNYGLPVNRSYPGYLIDNLYYQLKKDPSNDNARIKLINELVKHNRFEETKEQLNILENNFKGNNEFEKLKSSANKKRDEYYSQKISELKFKLEKNPNDSKSVLKLSEYLNNLNQSEDAIGLLENYLANNPNDKKVKFELAKLLAWNGEYDKSKMILTNLLISDPDNSDFNLLFGQICTWSGDYSNEATNALEFVLKNDPNNYQALYTLANLQYQKNNLVDASSLLKKAEIINPGNEDLTKLNFLISNKKEQNILNERYLRLTKARELVAQKKCDDAITIYKEVISESDDVQLQKELAEAYLCKNDYESAIEIYDRLLFNDKNNYDLIKHRAKIYFWSGNYISALNDLNKLNSMDDSDAEIKLMIADSYFYLKDFSRARQIYNEMLDASPDSYILQRRLSWFGPESGNEFSLSGFPTYTMLSPEANYFADNFDFLYSTYGLKFELGINQFLSLGVGGYGGILSNDTVHTNLSIVKGFAIARFSKNLSLSASAGVTNFPGSVNRFTGDIVFRAEERKLYSFSAGYYSADAAQILYSPFLVEQRLISNLADINGYYLIKNSWKFSGHFSYFLVSDKNRGNRLQLRLGKIIEKSLITGYEYYLFSFKEKKQIYWSPENFESHSIWAEWKISDTEKLSASLNGKLGYIPSEKYVLREFGGNVIYKFNNYFSLQGSVDFSTTVQSGRGYSSTNFSLSAFWNL